MTAATATTVQYLNLAYFGRPADPASLTAFPATGMTDEEIVAAFVKTNEYTTNTVTPATVGSTVNQTNLINTFYQRLFGRLAVSEEIAGWTTALATGTVNEDYLGITIMRAGLNLPAGTEMRSVLEAKFASADAFTTALANDASSAQAYSTSAAISSAQNFLSGVTTTTAATSAEVTAAVTSMVSTGAQGQTFTLTTGVDSISGTTDNDTIAATESTLTQGDTIKGGAGTDTLAVTAATASLSAVPTDLTLDSVEAISLSTTGDIGVNASTGTAQVDKITFPSVTADVQAVLNIAVAAATSDGAKTVTYLGNTANYLSDADKPKTTIPLIVAAINAATGSTVAYAGVTANGVVDIAEGTYPTGFDGTKTIKIASATPVIKVGMTVAMADGGSEIGAGATVTQVTVVGSDTHVEISSAFSADVSTESMIFGGGEGVDKATGVTEVGGGITVFGASDGTASLPVFNAPTGITTSYTTSGVAGNEGTVVNFTYKGQSGQYTIGADADATATAFAAALNAVASDATAAVVAVTSGSDYVTLTSDAEGTALGSLEFSNAGSNSPTVTTTTPNGTASVTAAAYDVSGLTTDSVSVTLADSVNLKSAAGDDVNISGVSGAITSDGGKNVVVGDKTADAAIDLNNVAGTATITDTKQGSGAITVDKATDVTITSSAVSTGTTTVGATDAVTGAVVISSTGTDYDASASALTLGAIRVDGATTVNVTSSVGDSAKAAADTSSVTTHTQGAVTVNAEDNTSSISITQSEAVAAVDAVASVTGKSATHLLTFTDAASGDAITLTFATNQTIVFTAAKALTAAEVAGAFANIAKDGTHGSAKNSDGVYTNGSATLNEGWSSGGVTTNADGTASVTFSSATASATIASLANAGTGTATLGSVVAGTTAATAVTGRMGVATGAIDINGATTSTADALKSVTLTNFASGNVDSDVLESITATGTAGALVIDSENTGTLTASVGSFASGSQLSLATATKFTGLTVNTTGTFVGDLVASDVTSLTINSDYAFTGEGSTDIDAVKTLTITGSGAVDLSADVVAAATSIDASSNTGGVSVHYHGNVGTFTGGSGNDVVESQTEAISKAVSLGGGDDTFILEAHSSGTTVTAALDGGSGTDTISMTGAAAVALDGNTVFGDDLTNFEILKLGALANSANVSAKNLGRTVKSSPLVLLQMALLPFPALQPIPLSRLMLAQEVAHWFLP